MSDCVLLFTLYLYVFLVLYTLLYLYNSIYIWRTVSCSTYCIYTSDLSVSLLYILVHVLYLYQSLHVSDCVCINVSCSIYLHNHKLKSKYLHFLSFNFDLFIFLLYKPFYPFIFKYYFHILQFTSKCYQSWTFLYTQVLIFWHKQSHPFCVIFIPFIFDKDNPTNFILFNSVYTSKFLMWIF